MEGHALRTRDAIKVRSYHILPASAPHPPLPPSVDRWNLLVLGVLATLLFFARLPCGLLEPEEARYAEIARQMTVEGRFLTPVWHGEDYLHKPPLLYWLLMLSYAVFGVHDGAARLVPCLAGVGTVLATYWWARAFLGRRAAMAGALVLLLSGKFLYMQGMVLFDGLLCLWVTLGWACGHLALRRFSWALWLGGAVCCALGILTKGPVAAVLIGGGMGIWLWMEGRGRADRGSAANRGRPGLVPLGAAYAAVVLLTAGPWFVYLACTHPAAFTDFFWLHHVRRFSDPLDHAEPWWFFLPHLVLGMLPWSLWCVTAWRGRWSGLRRTAPFWLAGGMCVVFFSLSGCKRAAYILPAFPPLALALGWYGRNWAAGLGRALLPGTYCLLLAGTLFWLPGYHERFGMRDALRPIQDLPEEPVFCLPRHWDSVSFYLGQEVRETADVEVLLPLLEGQERAWVIVRRRDAYPELMKRWPEHLEFQAQGPKHPNVVVGWVTRRACVPPTKRAARWWQPGAFISRRSPPPG